ncbi:condensation domain-containing protein [Mortierella sp. GBAus27b]|nr:condensation domain-containing protein [Mortierella sp. GBAus27b]
MTDSVASANSLSHVHSSWKDGEENLPDHDLAHRDPWSKVLAGTPGSFPLSLITPVTTDLTPEMLPLANLTQPDIDRIVEQTPGKVSNIQDIYPLLPLQDTLLHRLPGVKADPYLIISQIAFENKDLLDRYLQASQKVVDRHDILRTAFVWKDISTPPQVVWRHATIPIQELVLDPANGPAIKQLEQRFHPKHYRINLAQAPLMQCAIAQETDGRWMLLLLMHQLIGDRVASEMMNLEIEQILHGQESSLPIPWTSHNLFMQISEAATHEGHERFFKATLGDVENPTFPFGLSNTHTNGENITESSLALPQDLNDRLRFHAKQVGVTLASLCHVAWAQVVARTSGQDDVVFGTVLPGGQEWSNAMGPSTNTLPFRCDTDTKVRECIQRTQLVTSTDVG